MPGDAKRRPRSRGCRPSLPYPSRRQRAVCRSEPFVTQTFATTSRLPADAACPAFYLPEALSLRFLRSLDSFIDTMVTEQMVVMTLVTTKGQLATKQP